MQLSKSFLAVLLSLPILGSDGSPGQPLGLRVHEWGTFTSVAGEDGTAVPWSPLAAPADLPCFVVHLASRCIKCAPTATPRPSTVPTSTVRMETPVLYFYAQQHMELSIRADFPQGWITEWYPQATRVTPDLNHYQDNPIMTPLGGGSIEWKTVDLVPSLKSNFPSGQGTSHYYAARATDATPLVHTGQAEKFLFYRGIANFAVPLRVKVRPSGAVQLHLQDGEPLPLAIVFENRAGKTGFRIVRNLTADDEIPSPELTADPAALHQDLAAALVSMGLYEKEAAAMIETWRDSWFEEGMRVFYLVPRSTVDRVLPLTIQPAPRNTARVFVGRVEVLSPYLRKILAAALEDGDTATLAKYGRFLEPFAQQIPGSMSNPATAAFFNARRAEALKEFNNPNCVR